MIQFLFLLAFFATASTQDLEVTPGCSSCVKINDTCYNVTHILELSAPFRNTVVIHKLGILRSVNMLYFSFEPTIDDDEYFKIGFVNLDNHTESGIFSSPDQLLNFGTFDIDQDNELVYMGGSKGIFVLDTKAYKLTPYSSRGDTIRNIFFKTNVNFLTNNDKGIIVKRGDNFNTLFEDTFIKNFVITKYDVVVYLSNFGLFLSKGDLKIRISQNAFFRGLHIDLDGTVYAWWIDGVYKVIIEKTLEDSKIVRVASLPVAIGGMTFDNDNNMLFTVDKTLFKLTPTEGDC